MGWTLVRTREYVTRVWILDKFPVILSQTIAEKISWGYFV